MVKRDMKMSISEDDADVAIPNENGKRPADDQNKDTKKRIKTRGLYRQPTVNELNRLQETENLFNSNLFRLQVEEILQEVQIKEKTEKRFQQWFTDFKIYLEAISNDDTEYNLSEQTLVKKLKVKLPVSDKLSKTRCMFKFYKFKDVRIVGSHSLGCAINSKLRIDIQLSVPAQTYTKNDSINYRYHKKRAAYLAFIASHLSKTESVQDLQYTWVDGSETKPVLDFKPSGKLGNHLSVRINLVCEEESYKLHRFSPTRNNLREAWLLGSEGESTDIGSPTPYYNSSVLSDLTAEANQELLNEILLKSENLKQAVILLKIWLRQRDLAVPGHVINLIVAYFVQNKRVNNIMSSYQIVRNIWIAIKTSEWDTKGISLHKGTDTPALEEFHQHFPVVFIDKTGYYNICWQMSKGIYYALRRESALAVDMLDNPKINSFLPLFMIPVKPLMKFDHILRFKNLENLKNIIISKSSKESRLYYGLETLALVTETVLSLLIKGLGNRADLIQPLVDANFSWPVKKKADKGHEEKLSFGLIYNTEHALNTVEKGPPANLPEAEQFRAFWGDKSELRRFQDGSITETCVWEAESAADRRAITTQIINYLLELKFGIPEAAVYHVSEQLEGALCRRRWGADAAARAEESAARTLHAFDELRRDLRQLTQLPLNVSAVYGVSSVFSYSDPLPPLPRAPANKPWRRGDASLIKTITKDDGTALLPEYVPVCKTVLELGHSGKWPGDIEAFRCLKAAFHLQISDRLREQYSLPAQAYPTHVDVLKNGLVFRLVIAHPKEITLLRREMENGVVKHTENEESVMLQRDTVLLPRLRGALHGLHQKYPAFGPTACLLKRWLSAHLLSGHVPSVVAELLTAAVFVHSPPVTPPASPTLGFFRVLDLLVRTDWTTDVIVLDFNEDMTREEISELERKLTSGETPAPCLRIVTAYDDNTPAIWSASQPTAPVLARVTALASSTLQYGYKQMMEEFGDHLLGAFIPSLSGYDVVLHLSPPLVPHAGERVDKKPTLRRMPADVLTDLIPVVEFHPVMKYLEELRNAYSEFALFFHDRYGGVDIAVLWKPDINDLRDFQVANAHALVPVTVDGETKYKVNTAALVEDFRILGEGLVKDITVNS
ncbi:nucleolar protein 6 isoform X1 [Manduca sexta]|uniref:nucleolar protein 6 isoform X1 n=2 Tax=Manduca sexta TaxID=7130 RepID=UPI00188E66C5|nr:nucleolar protein 6 isoform X1 [Manduca sexta]